MSQAKVDQYKAEKKNRKANMKKEKRKKLLWKIFGPIIAILVIALIGVGVYFIPQWTNQKAGTEQGEEIDYDQLMQMINQYAEEDNAEGEGTEDNTGEVAADAEENAETEDTETATEENEE